MAAYLVTGNPGSGKTTMVAELTQRGFGAIDIDEFAGWVDGAGLPVDQPPNVTDGWLAAHRWVWSRTRFESAIRAAGQCPLFFCGIALNQLEMFDLFDRVFLLTLDDQTQLDRLNAASNAGRNAAQRAQIVEGRPVFEKQMRDAGAVVLDGRKPTSTLADLIVGSV